MVQEGEGKRKRIYSSQLARTWSTASGREDWHCSLRKIGNIHQNSATALLGIHATEMHAKVPSPEDM